MKYVNNSYFLFFQQQNRIKRVLVPHTQNRRRARALLQCELTKEKDAVEFPDFPT